MESTKDLGNPFMKNGANGVQKKTTDTQTQDGTVASAYKLKDAQIYEAYEREKKKRYKAAFDVVYPGKPKDADLKSKGGEKK